MDDARQTSHNNRSGPGFLRVAGALSLSALLSALAIGAVFTALKLVQDGQGLDGWSIGLVLYSIIALTFALPIALLLGGPLYFLLSRRGPPPLLPLVISAGILAVVPFLIIGNGAFPVDSGVAGLVPLSIFLFLVGCAGGAIFWKLAGLRRTPGEGGGR